MNARHLADARVVRRERAVVADFWAQVDCPAEPDACWRWRGRTDRTGRSVLRVRNYTVYAVRVAVYAVTGEYPIAPRIRHACGDATCVRPSHARWHTSVVHQRQVAAYSDGYGRQHAASIDEERAAASAWFALRLAS
jgi:hypothetical protein